MLEQTIMLDEIRESFSVLQNYIRPGGKLNKNDSNVDAEDFVAGVLNTLNGWKLVNTNKGVANTPCIDLIDRQQRIGVQVSSQKDNEISAAASCGVSERAQRRAAAGKWPLRRPLGTDEQGYGASSEALTS